VNESHQLKKLTNQLIKASEYLLETFQRVKETGNEEDFYTIVRPFANGMKEMNDSWNVLAKEWIKKNQPDYLNARQIDSASDHIEIISIQAFFPQTSKKRFLDSYKSVLFILQTMQKELTIE